MEWAGRALVKSVFVKKAPGRIQDGHRSGDGYRPLIATGGCRPVIRGKGKR